MPRWTRSALPWIISTRSADGGPSTRPAPQSIPQACCPDGTRFEGVAGLRQVLLSHPERFVSTLTENLLAYALGRSLEYYDQPVVRTVVRDSAPRDYRFSELVLGIVNSPAFLTRKAEAQQTGPRRHGTEETTIMIITKRALPRRTFLRGMGATVALPFPGRNGSGTVRTGRQADRQARICLYSERHDSADVGARHHGKELRAVADSQPVGAGARSHHGVERTGAPTGGQPRRRQRRPCARHGRLADRCARMGPRPWRR